MPLFWKSPFNKVVRSTEALTLGLAIGLVVGSVIGSVLIPTVISDETYSKPIRICGKASNVLRVKIKIHGILSEVECKDGRVFNNFK